MAFPLLLGLGLAGAVAVAASSSSSSSKAKAPPAKVPFVDAESYFQQIAQQGAEVQAIAAARADESDERVKKWKATAKQIPVIGDFAGTLIDLGAWLGKVLGSNYAEENSPEDLQHAAEGISKWIEVGLVPPVPLFTAKNGANAYGRQLDRGLELLRQGADKSAADNLTARALSTMATLTMLNAGCPAMDRGILDAASGNGSLGGVGWYGGKLVGFESIVAGIASCEFGVSYDDAFAYARKVTDHAASFPIQPGLVTSGFANAFTETMRAASHGEIGPPKLLVKVAGDPGAPCCSACAHGAPTCGGDPPAPAPMTMVFGRYGAPLPR
jgi:hypothetical protein